MNHGKLMTIVLGVVFSCMIMGSIFAIILQDWIFYVLGNGIALLIWILICFVLYKIKEVKRIGK